MKKIAGLILGAVAVVALSGCSPTGDDNPWNGSGNNQGTSISSVDIKKLHSGYIIMGYDYGKGRNVEIDFCGSRPNYGGHYDYYRDGASTQSGTFNIKDGDRLTESRINFFMNDGHTSYRIDTEDDNNYGLLKVGHTYKIKFQNEEINIDKIYTWPDC